MSALRRFWAAVLLFFRRGPLAAFLLGVSSGFPLNLLIATMGFWLAREGIKPETIGYAITLTTPFTLKFLWAPLIDRWQIPVLSGIIGHRRSYLLVIGIALILAIAALGHSDPKSHLDRFAFWALVVSFLAASQDIVIDAYRIEILSDAELAHGTAMAQFGYRVGFTLIAGGGVIWLASAQGAGLGWAQAYSLSGLCVIFAWIAAWMCGEPARILPPGNAPPEIPPAIGDAPAARRRNTLRSLADLFKPVMSFLARKDAWLILGFILLFKLGDAMGQVMLQPMVVELGFQDGDFAFANGFVGLWALIAGAALAPLFLHMVGLARALMISGFLMALTNVGFAALAAIGPAPWALASAIGFENFASGLGLTLFTAYLAGLTQIGFTATQYALLSSVSALGRTFLAAPSGKLVAWTGFGGFYGITILAAIPGLILLAILLHRKTIGAALQRVRPVIAD